MHQDIAQRVRSLERVSDRRHHARIALELPVRYAVKGDVVTVVASLGDLSSGGMFIRTPTPPLIGQTVACGFIVGDDPAQMVAVRGKVAWRKLSGRAAERGFGVRVLLAAPEHRERIESLVASATPPRLGPTVAEI